MIKESYTEKFYSYHSKYINNALALRPPQHESLEIFARLCDTLSLRKNPTTVQQISEAHQAELDACETDEKRQKRISEVLSALTRAELSAGQGISPAELKKISDAASRG